jgi:chromosome partitioning protein
MRTVAIVNQKGGSGKTTSAINLASILAKRGQRTLLVDVDPQSHCALGLAVPGNRIDLSIADALGAAPDKQPDPARLFWSINKHLDLAPSTTRLAGLEAPRGVLAEAPDREERLLNVLRPHRSRYDWCLIDCSPSIGLLTFNALRAADYVLIPVETAYFALRGAERQIGALEALIRRCGHNASYAVFATMHRADTRVGQDVLAQLNDRFAKCLIPIVVRYDESLREAASLGMSILDHAPRSNAARDYTSLAAWLMEHAPEGRSFAPIPARPPEEPDTDEEAPAHTNGHATPALAPGGERNAPALEPVTARVGLNGGTLSRAAELAARAREISLRNAETQQRAESEEEQAPVISELTSIHPPVVHAPATTERVRTLSPDQLAALYGARPTARGVLFVYPAGPDVEVCVAADVNGWSATAHRMRYNADLAAHEICIPFPKGRHPYRYVVSGQWITDPHNPYTVPNPYGQLDSVVEVGSMKPDTIPPDQR